MSKKHFIALADMIREHNRIAKRTGDIAVFTQDQLDALAMFCRQQNGEFKRDRWLDYIAGECGKNGGRVKAASNEV